MFLVCGEALFDFFPERNDSMGNVGFDARVGGSPFNVAIGLARLDVPSALLSGVSTDMLGERLVEVLEHEGVATQYLVRNDRRTTLSLVGLDQSGSPSYSFYGTDSADCGVKYKHLPAISDDLTGLHFGSYSTVVKPAAKAFAKLAKKQRNKFISYDPNIRPTIEPNMDVWRKTVDGFADCADMIKISMEDFALLYPDTDPGLKAKQWFDQGVSLVILTDGGQQIDGWVSSGLIVSVTPPKLDVVDTVGAGDTFQAAILKGILELDSPKEALANIDEEKLRSMMAYAAQAAALTCTKRGADMPTLQEMDSIVSGV